MFWVVDLHLQIRKQKNNQKSVFLQEYVPLHEQVGPSHSWNEEDEDDEEKQNL